MDSACRGPRSSRLWRLAALAVLVAAFCWPVGPKSARRAAQVQTTFLPLAFKLASPQDIPTLQPLFKSFLLLDGADDYASAPDRSALDLGRGSSPDFTIETFIYIDASGPSGARTLIEREQFSIELLLASGTADGIRLHIRFESGELSLFPVLNLAAGWHHLAIVFDDQIAPDMDRAAIYLDGSLEAFRTSPYQGSVLNSSQPL